MSTASMVVVTDMQTTPEAAFEEAMQHIFVQKEEVHRFAMPNKSRKHPHKARWTLFEMWPINVSLSQSNPAT
jgi:hypothetical protein